MRSVADIEIAAYWSIVAKQAWKLTGVARAEFDDLHQEGLIAVWAALRDGYRPTNEFIRRRMLNWVEACRRKGFTYE